MNKKRTGEKKGISLIVLVITIIVIIILAVAVILSIANNNPIEKAKEARFKNDVKTMQEELELLKESNYAKNNGASYDNPDRKKITIDQLQSASNYKEKFAVKDGELKYIAEKLTDEEKTWVSASGITEQIILKMGREITYKNEPFYIIGGDEVGTEVTDTTQDILLLAKYNLTSDGTSQDKTGESNGCAFSSTNYWSSVSGIAYPDTNGKYPDLNNEAKYGTGSSVIAKAKAYGASLGVTGRLMTYEEAEKLNTDHYSTILYGTYKEGLYLNYGLGSAATVEDRVWLVGGVYSTLTPGGLLDNDSCGVRPVIKVSKSLIK